MIRLRRLVRVAHLLLHRRLDCRPLAHCAWVLLYLLINLRVHAREHNAENNVRNVLHAVGDIVVAKAPRTDGKDLANVAAADDNVIAWVRLYGQRLHDKNAI